MRPGISFSDRSMSLRPSSASLMSAACHVSLHAIAAVVSQRRLHVPTLYGGLVALAMVIDLCNKADEIWPKRC